MNGGGDSSRGGESGSRLGLITLEDLDSLTDEDMDAEQPAVGAADPGGDTEAVEEEGQERLLAFWQNIGRGHRIDIPEGELGMVITLGYMFHCFLS